jgi:hypothetical protein
MGFFSINKETGDKEKEFVINQDITKSFPLKKERFILIKDEKAEDTLFFIDGGIQELYKKGNSAFYILKIAYSEFLTKKRVGSKTYETIVRIDRGNKIEVSFKDDLSFLAEKDILEISEENDFEENINQIRRILELELATYLSSSNENVSIVIDGSLLWKEYDEKNIDSLIKTSLDKNNQIIGLSKSTTLTTNKGNNVIDVLSEIGPEGQKWLYFPLFYGKKGLKSGCFKLHPRAPLAFRFDVLNVEENVTKENLKLIQALMFNSTDGCFLGYPYGLVYVDKIARISNNEAEYLRTKYFLSKKKEEVKAHDILDNMS